MSFTATYDACVLHPAGLRDLLIRLAMTDLFRANWERGVLSYKRTPPVPRRQSDAGGRGGLVEC